MISNDDSDCDPDSDPESDDSSPFPPDVYSFQFPPARLGQQQRHKPGEEE